MRREAAADVSFKHPAEGGTVGQAIARELLKAERLLDGDLDAPDVVAVLELLGATRHHAALLAESRIYNDLLPKAVEVDPTPRERALHLLWDAFDKLPMSVVVDFSIPFRRLIAERLFKRCGSSFIADEGVRFNYGQLLEVGDDVFLNRGVFLDTKGGVTIGDAACMTEWVAVFTHSHSESDHTVRAYAPVVVEPYAKIYSDAIILPGVTVGEEGIVAARSLVTRDVPPGEVVGGIPAVPIRERRSEGRHGEQLNHVWLAEAAFQHERAGRERALAEAR
jgi:acetyltransferase-like isoleucine patch superfamily enzyme